MLKKTLIFGAVSFFALGTDCSPAPLPGCQDGSLADQGSSAADLGSSDSDLAGPSTVHLTITTSGGGDGDIATPLLIGSCAPRCVLTVTRGAKIELQASPAADSFWEQWQGACSDQGQTCQLTATTDQEVAVHFRRWTAEPSGTTASLRSIWGRSATDLWAVGSSSTVLHYDGTSWLPARLGVPLDRTLNGVHGNASALYVVGSQATLLRWDTDRFVAESLESSLPADSLLRAVWTTPSGVAFAVGAKGLILRRLPSGRWQRESINPGEELTAVWGSGPEDVWVAGGKALLHLTASGWSAVDSPEFGTQYYTLSGSAARSVWAGADFSRIHRFDGVKWQRDLDFPSSGDPVLGLSASARGELYALSGYNGEIYRATAATWQKTPQPAGKVALLAAFSAPTGETWVVGDRGTLLFTRP